MRNVIFGINLTIDGCCDHTKGIGSEDVHEYFTNLMRNVDLLVYGRKTYELMVPFWPDVAKNNSGGTKTMNEFAHIFTAIDKVVFSQTLSGTEEKNTRIVRTGLREEILKLKQQDGKNISTGGVALPTQLMKLGLIDEYYIVVHPIVAGEGRRLFDNTSLQERLQLKLVDTKTLLSGCVALHYLKQ